MNYQLFLQKLRLLRPESFIVCRIYGNTVDKHISGSNKSKYLVLDNPGICRVEKLTQVVEMAMLSQNIDMLDNIIILEKDSKFIPSTITLYQDCDFAILDLIHVPPTHEP